EVKKAVEGGGGTVTDVIAYDPSAADFAAEVSKIKAGNPSGLALIAFDETKKIIPELIKQGIGPDKIKIYFVDGNLADYSQDFPKGTLKGVKGTQPGAKVTDEFKDRMLKVDPNLKDFNYGPESYDAAMLIAIAA